MSETDIQIKLLRELAEKLHKRLDIKILNKNRKLKLLNINKNERI